MRLKKKLTGYKGQTLEDVFFWSTWVELRMMTGMKGNELWAASQPPAFLLDKHTLGIQVYLNEQDTWHYRKEPRAQVS